MAEKNQLRYRVFFTPIDDLDTNSYGTEIDVSDRITVSGIGNIKRALDSQDYLVGTFFFSDLTLKGANENGYFNDNTDYRSIFKVTRDLCKVRIVFEQILITRKPDKSGTVTDAVTTNTMTFNGLINEEATKLDASKEDITFKVLSTDSVLRTTNVPAGVVSSGSTIKTAIESILDQPRITETLNFSAANINPDLNITIDDGSFFDNKPVQEAMNFLLLVSNSIMYVDSSLNIIVKDRLEDDTRPILNLYGKSDQLGRENIIDIKSYNQGIHRTYTQVRVNETTIESDNALAATFGFRELVVDVPFITDLDNKILIARRLLSEFKSPRIEMQVVVPTPVSRDAQLLDRVSINYPRRIGKPAPGFFVPIVGTAVIGDASTPLPRTFGSIQIPPNYAFKIIEIEDGPQKFETTLKLRQVNDFVFNTPNNCIVGFAIIGQAQICAGGNPCDTFNPSVVGAAKIGCTEIA